MSNIITLPKSELNIWNDPAQIAEIMACCVKGNKLTPLEQKIFIHIGIATGLNPFLREIWAVKYGTEASIFIGRDGYRKSAQRHRDYDYHQVDAVYENDEFKKHPSGVDHTYQIKDRGKLSGAYCIVKRKSSTEPMYGFVDFKEYTTNKALWSTKPATMIKKVAEAQVLRMAFQELFAGTYAAEELDQAKPSDQRLLDEMIKGMELSTNIEALRHCYRLARAKFPEHTEKFNDICSVIADKFKHIKDVKHA